MSSTLGRGTQCELLLLLIGCKNGRPSMLLRSRSRIPGMQGRAGSAGAQIFYHTLYSASAHEEVL